MWTNVCKIKGRGLIQALFQDMPEGNDKNDGYHSGQTALLPKFQPGTSRVKILDHYHYPKGLRYVYVIGKNSQGFNVFWSRASKTVTSSDVNNQQDATNFSLYSIFLNRPNMFRATNSPFLRSTFWLYIQFWYNAPTLLSTSATVPSWHRSEAVSVHCTEFY